MTPTVPLVRLMLDSGAYSVFHKGETVDLDAYCRFIEKNKRNLWQYVSLDVINDPEKTAQNHATMKARGLNPMAVFHCGEPLDFLKKMIADGEPYIGLSLSANANNLSEEGRERQKELLEEAFDVLKDQPDIRLHAFGIMAPSVLLPFREWFYSADATNWITKEYYGWIYAPPFDHALNGYNWQAEPIQMNVDDFGKSRVKTEAIQRWLNDSGIGYGKAVLAKVKRLKEWHRRALLTYYQQFCQANGIVPVFATLPDAKQAVELKRMNANTRLLSFSQIADWNRWDLSYYVKVGKVPPSKRELEQSLLEIATQYEPPEP